MLEHQNVTPLTCHQIPLKSLLSSSRFLKLTLSILNAQPQLSGRHRCSLQYILEPVHSFKADIPLLQGGARTQLAITRGCRNLIRQKKETYCFMLLAFYTREISPS